MDGRLARAVEPRRNDHERIRTEQNGFGHEENPTTSGCHWWLAHRVRQPQPLKTPACWPAAGSCAIAASGWAPWHWRSSSQRYGPRSHGVGRTTDRPSGAPGSASSGQGQARDLSVHGRRASHLELFDNKPQLAKFDGQLPPPELIKGYRAAFINPNSKLLGPQFKFARHGRCGAEVSRVVAAPGRDRRRCHDRPLAGDRRVQSCAGPDHDEYRQPAVRPAQHRRLDAYGLGAESQNLPGFVVMNSGKKGPSGGNSNWGSGFLPTVYQGVPFRTRATRCCTCRTRRASIGKCSATRSTRSRA